MDTSAWNLLVLSILPIALGTAVCVVLLRKGRERMK
jgi:hypothetical protein